MPQDDKYHVKDVVGNHGNALPHSQTTISQENQTEAGCNGEEANISDEAPFGNVERRDERHAPCDHSRDEAGGTNQFSHCQTPTVTAHRCKRREHIWTTIAECQKCDPSQTLAHAQDIGDCAEIDTQKIGGSDTDRAEQETGPYDNDKECHRLGVGKVAIVEFEVGDEAGLFVGAIQFDKGTLVFCMVDEATLRRFSSRNLQSLEYLYLKVACFETALGQVSRDGTSAIGVVSKEAITGKESDDEGGQIEGATLLAHRAHSFSCHVARHTSCWTKINRRRMLHWVVNCFKKSDVSEDSQRIIMNDGNIQGGNDEAPSSCSLPTSLHPEIMLETGRMLKRGEAPVG